MLTLGIDTSGNIAAVAICDDNILLAQASIVTKRTHSQIILPLCEEVLAKAELDINDIECFSVAKGPGSYTGLRIGISTVKGICFNSGAKCVGISTLESLAYNFYGLDATVCVVMHARQSLVYNAIFKIEGDKVTRICDDRIIEVIDLYEEIKDSSVPMYFNGDYAETFLNEFECDKFSLAPPQLRMQNAASLCFAALNHDKIEASELNAEYMQITKAEKDLITKKANGD